MASTSDITGLIADNAVQLDNTDLSTQVLSTIFGDGWWNITTGGGDTVIYDLLMTLNSCCAVAVAWLMILTVLIASVGSAQEGRSIGGRYASAWVPLRFSFAFAAITPIVKGMCAMQILILACIGVSIDLANKMYETGLNYLAKGGAFTAIAPPSAVTVGQQLAAGAVQSQALISYLQTQGGCTNVDPVSISKAVEGNDIVLYFTAPANLSCSGRSTKLPVNAFGGFRFPASGHPELDADRIVTIQKMVAATAGVGKTLAEMNPTYDEIQTVLAAGSTYSNTMATATTRIVTQSTESARNALKNFADVASTSGWFTLGSYYWTMASSAQAALDQVTDTTTYFEPEFELLNANLHASWSQNVVANLARIKEGATLNVLNEKAAASSSAAATVSEVHGIGWMSTLFNFATTPPWDYPGNLIGGMVSGTAGLISGSDAILRTVQYSRWFVSGVTGAMILLEGLKVAALSGKEAKDRSWWGFIADQGSMGATAAGAEAAVTIIKDLWILGMLALGSLWVFATFVAFVVPAMPFLIWVAAIVGWIVLSLEAVIAAPVWLVGHAMPEGEGFAGQHGRQGYLLILGILLRPCLLVLSMIVCIVIMQATGTMVEALFHPFMKGMETIGPMGIVGNIFLFVTLAGMVALLTWKVFELVTAMPDRIIRWMGHGMQQLGNEAAQANAQDVVGGTKSAAGHTAKAGGIAIALAGSGGGTDAKADRKSGDGGGGGASSGLDMGTRQEKTGKEGNREY